MKIDVEHIVAGCQRKEPRAQRMLYEAFAPEMLGVCMRYTHSRDEAQDLLHDGFIKIFDRIGQLRNPQSVAAWMYRIMVSESVSYVRRSSEVVCCDMSELEGSEALPADGGEWMDTDGYDVARVVRALRQLPDHYRLAFNMREVEEMEYADIAEELGQPETTVRNYAWRARRMIKEIIDNEKA